MTAELQRRAATRAAWQSAARRGALEWLRAPVSEGAGAAVTEWQRILQVSPPCMYPPVAHLMHAGSILCSWLIEVVLHVGQVAANTPRLLMAPQVKMQPAVSWQNLAQYSQRPWRLFHLR